MRTRPRLASLVAAALLVLTTALSGIASTTIASADDNVSDASSGGLAELGVIDPILGPTSQDTHHSTGTPATSGGDDIPPMVVDSAHRLGFVIGYYNKSSWDAAGAGPAPSFVPSGTLTGEYLLAFDLDRRALIGEFRTDDFTVPGDDPNLTSLAGCVADATTEHLICSSSANDWPGSVCAANGQVLDVIDYSDVEHMTMLKEPSGCSGGLAFLPFSVTLDAADGKLYLAGTYDTEEWRYGPLVGLAAGNGAEQPLVLAQLDLAKIYKDPANMVDWSVDLRYAGCGEFTSSLGSTNGARPNPLIARVGNTLISACSDAREGTVQGALGYIVRIPLSDGTDAHPLPTCGPSDATASGCQPLPDPNAPGASTYSMVNYAFALMPTLSGNVTSGVDPQTGDVMLATADAVNGDAVWAFDPHPGAERFVGVITGGQQDQPPGKTAAGFNPATGRSYLLTPDGILVAQTRLNPLPAGDIYPVVNHSAESVSTTARPAIDVVPAADGKPTLLLVPIVGVGYRVVEDDVPDANTSAPDDSCTDSGGNTWSGPDCLTDPSLSEDPKTTQITSTGAAQASGVRVLVTGGLRALEENNDPVCQPNSVWHQPVDLSGTGPPPDGECVVDNAFAQGDSDFSLGATDLTASSDFGSSAAAGGLVFPPSDSADRTNFQTYGQSDPYTPVDCTDGGGAPSSANSPTGPDAGMAGLTAMSVTKCDAGTVSAQAASAVSAIAVPNPTTPVVTVAQTTSSIVTGDTTDGQETISQAVANGITIGGTVSIGQMVAQATTLAHGHAGTTKTTYARQWCAITVAGQTSVPGCIDPDDPTNASVIDKMDQALGSTWITAPAVQKQATPGGYQAVAAKDPGEAQADATVNNDTSPQVPALQIIHYNDGPAGLSRLIVQLGNIDIESRYSVVSQPDFGAFGDGGLLPDLPDLSPSSSPTPSLSPIATAQPQQSQMPQPVPQATTPTPQVRSRYVPPTREIRTVRPVAAVAPAPLTHAGTPPALAPAVGLPPSGIIAAPQQVISRAIHLLVENPAQFALLAGIWVLLLAPVFVAYRRRSWARALES